MQPEPASPVTAEEQGGDPPADDVNGSKGPKRKRKAVAAPERVEDMKLYLTEDVRFRLRMLAFKRNAKLSTVANEVLDRALPRWKLEREE
jgi:hypothetical protein